MPRALHNSNPFKIEIFKDQWLTQKIVEMTKGVVIDSNRILPGAIEDALIEPLISEV
jgi:hypothetical protein